MWCVNGYRCTVKNGRTLGAVSLCYGLTPCLGGEGGKGEGRKGRGGRGKGGRGKGGRGRREGGKGKGGRGKGE